MNSEPEEYEDEEDEDLKKDPLLVLLDDDNELSQGWHRGELAIISRVADLLLEIHPRHFREPLRPPLPTRERGGTKNKVEVMAERAGPRRWGGQYALWHPFDDNSAQPKMEHERNNRRRLA